MKRVLATVLILALIWGVGLVAFGQRVARMTPTREPPVADAVVALTGASDLRLETAVWLLERGKGRHLFISGVNKVATPEEVMKVIGAPRSLQGRIKLGYSALDTIGNAGEITAWARSRHYRRLIVVTSDYHMPRTLLLLHAAMPEATLTPYPLVTSLVDARHWWRRSGDARRLTIEYCKYLAILARESVRSLGSPSHKAAPEPAAAKRTKS